MTNPALSETDLLIAYCGNPLDRAEDRRGDAAWLEAALYKGRYLLVEGRKVAMAPGLHPDFAWLGHDRVAHMIAAGRTCVFLGRDENDRPVFALESFGPDDLSGNGEVFIDGRSIAMQLADPARDRGHTGIVAQALSIIAWHRRNRFCAQCGGQTAVRRGGYQRYCKPCDLEHYPRTDPVAIMLVVKGDRCLLGRQAHFTPRMYSALAGFVEAGESLEQAVRREVHEETGVIVGSVSYIGSQPWPFPSNLMLGFIAEAKSEAITIDPHELADAQWFDRDMARSALALDPAAPFLAPPSIAIAHHLLKHWLDEGHGLPLVSPAKQEINQD